MNYFDWGRLDLAAAVNAMSSAEMPLYIVGHSFGGHAFGMLPNHARVAGLYTFGTGAGWHGWMPPLERIKVLAMWHLLGPLLTRWKGYLSWSLLGLGEDLPIDYLSSVESTVQGTRTFLRRPFGPSRGAAVSVRCVRRDGPHRSTTSGATQVT